MQGMASERQIAADRRNEGPRHQPVRRLVINKGTSVAISTVRSSHKKEIADVLFQRLGRDVVDHPSCD